MAIEQVAIRISSNAKDIEKQISAIDSRLEQLHNGRKQIQIDAGNLAKVKKSITDIDVEIKKLRAQKAEVRVSGADADTVRKKMADIQEEINKLNAKKARLQVDALELKGADTQAKNLYKEMDTLNRKKARLQVEEQELEQADKSADKLKTSLNSIDGRRININVSENLTKLGGHLDNIGTKMLTFAKRAALVGGALGIAGGKQILSLFGDYETTMNQVQAISGAGEADLTRLSNQIKQLGADSVYSASEVGQAALELTKGGLEQAQIEAGALSNTINLAAASGLGMEESAIALSNAMNSFGIEASKTNDIVNAFAGGANASSADVSDLTLALSQASAGAVNAGMDLNETIGALSALADAGIKGSDAGTSLKTMLARLIPMTDPAIKAMNKYGLSFQDANGNIDDMATIAEKLKNQLGDLSEAERTEALNRIFGSDSSRAASILMRRGAEGIIAYTEATKDQTAAQRMADANMRGWNGTIERTQGSIETMALTVGEKLGPAFAPLADMVGGLADKVTKYFGENEETIDAFVDNITNKLTTFADKVLNFDWGSFGEGLKEGFGGIKDFLNGFKPLLDIIKDFITNLGEGSFAKGLGELPALFIKIAGGAKALGIVFKGLGKFTNFKLPSFGGGGSGETGGGFTFNFDAGKMLNQVKNLALVAGAIGNIMLLAEAMKQINEKVPANFSALAPKMANMGIALVGMGAMVALAGALSKDFTDEALAGLLIIAGIAVDLMIMAEAMKQINTKVPSSIKNVAKKIANIGIAVLAMGALAGVIGLVMVGTGGIGALVVGGGLLAIAGIASQLIFMAEAINQVNTKVPSNFDTVKEKINSIASVVKYMSGIAFGTAFTALQEIIDTIQVAIVAATINRMVALVEELRRFDTAFNELPDIEEVKNKVTQIAGVVEAISDNGNATTLFEDAIGLIEDFIEMLDVGIIARIVGKYTVLTEQIKKLMVAMDTMPTADDIGVKVAEIGLAIEALSPEDLRSPIQSVLNLWKSIELGALLGVMQNLNNIASTINEFNMTAINTDQAKVRIDNIALIADKITEVKKRLVDAGKSEGSSYGVNANINALTNLITELNNIITGLNDFTSAPFDILAINARIFHIKEIMRKISEIPPAAEGADVGAAIVQQLTDAIEKLDGMSRDFGFHGKTFGENLLEGWNGVKLPDGMVKEVESALVKIGEKSTKFTEIGREFGTKLRNAFGIAITGMNNKVDSEITTIANMWTRFSTIGNTFGTKLADAFKLAISGMATEASKQINAVKDAASSIGNVASGIGSVGSNVVNTLSTGGVVQYRDSGGTIFKPRGTDTVPAMLTPGEFVVKRDTVSQLGTSFMQRLNNGDFSNIIRGYGLSARMRANAQSVISNVHNDNSTRNDNKRVTQNIHGGQNYSFRKLKRIF